LQRRRRRRRGTKAAALGTVVGEMVEFNQGVTL
jgi:hypothetical protein